MHKKDEQKFIGTTCFICRQWFKMPLAAKCYTCPHCGHHGEFDAAKSLEGLKKIMRKVYGAAPDKPENN